MVFLRILRAANKLARCSYSRNKLINRGSSADVRETPRYRREKENSFLIHPKSASLTFNERGLLCRGDKLSLSGSLVAMDHVCPPLS